MRWSLTAVALVSMALTSPAMAETAPTVAAEPLRLTVTGRDYRATFRRDRFEIGLELRGVSGRWEPVTAQGGVPEFAISDAAGVHGSQGAPVRFQYEVRGDAVAVGVTTVLTGAGSPTARLDVLCRDEGMLVRFTPGAGKDDAGASCWALPRIPLDPAKFGGYAFWRAPDEPRTGTIAGLGANESYAGVSPWGQNGDTARALSPAHPALIARRRGGLPGLGVVLVDARERWDGSHSFLQRYNASSLYLYAATVPLGVARGGSSAWLSPLPDDPAAAAKAVERLASTGSSLARSFNSVAPEADAGWTRVLPDFPAGLRRPGPVSDIRRAVVYTVNEPTTGDEALDMARKVGSDVLIRGWFKWGTAPDWSKHAHLVPKAHSAGSLFGGGITCSALYEGESGLSPDEILAMATRGPDGRLVDAWGEKNCRHGSLSSRKYLAFLLESCKRQVDAGADVFFMDEINAALQADEGFDDASVADFREFLLDRAAKQGWTADDPRWTSAYRVDLSDRSVVPDGTMRSFLYRDYLKKLGLTASPHSDRNPLAASWQEFREERDDRAWKWLSD